MFSALICLFSAPLLLHCLNYLKMDNTEQLERQLCAVVTVYLTLRDYIDSCVTKGHQFHAKC